MMDQQWLVWSTGFAAQNKAPATIVEATEEETEPLFPRTSYTRNNDYGCYSRCPPPQPPTPAYPCDGRYVNLAAMDDDDDLFGTLELADPYYDEVPAESEATCWQAIPTADTVRTACRRLLVEVEDDRAKLRVGRVCSDMFVEMIQLGSASLRLGSYREDDLNHCVDAARRAAPALMKATGLTNDADVDAVLGLLQSPYKLHALLSFNEHSSLLSTIVMCFRNLMLSLVLPSRALSPAELAVKSEVLLESSLHLVGAVNAK
eukprot:m.17727 g.17727  ORF g.17727 m.17727 type:complete len:261 (+) comp5215_c0_seq1:300-1082(+)